jgi:hypothetical protein
MLRGFALVLGALIILSTAAAAMPAHRGPPSSGPQEWTEFTVGLAGAQGMRAGEAFHGGQVIFVDQVLGFMAVRTPDAPGFERAAARDPGVMYVERAPQAVPLWTPDDTLFGHQWGLHGAPGIEAERAWDITRGSSDVKVAVIDTGMQVDHPDLPRVGAGYNHADRNTNIDDCHGHGTHVAGTIAAKTDNARGVAGVADATLMVGKVFGGDDCTGTFNNIANAITWAVDAGADVISISLGCAVQGCYHQATSQALAYAASRDVLAVCGAGNSGPDEDSVGFPANDANCMAVGALEQDGRVAGFSSRGDEVEIVAPGRSILSTSTGSRYTYASGTSMAAPHVSGTAALVLAASPGSSASEVRELLKASALDLGWPAHHQGAGALNAGSALAAFLPQAPEEEAEQEIPEQEAPEEETPQEPPAEEPAKEEPAEEEPAEEEPPQEAPEDDDSSGDGPGDEQQGLSVGEISLWRQGRHHIWSQITVGDQDGTALGGVEVSWTLCRSDGSCTAYSATTGSDGSVEARWMHAGSGTYTACVSDLQRSGYEWDSGDACRTIRL